MPEKRPSTSSNRSSKAAKSKVTVKVTAKSKVASTAASVKKKTAPRSKFPKELSISWAWSTAWQRLPQVAMELFMLVAVYLLVYVLLGVLVNAVFSEFFGWLLNQLISIAMSVAGTAAMLQIYRGKPVDISMVWKQPIVLWNYLLATVMIAVSVIAGLIFFIIPGIYIAIRLSYVLYLVVDKQMGAQEAFKRGWEMTQGRVGFLFLFGLTAFLAMIAGLLLLVVGLVVAVPLTALAQIAIYEYLLAKE